MQAVEVGGAYIRVSEKLNKVFYTSKIRTDLLTDALPRSVDGRTVGGDTQSPELAGVISDLGFRRS